jgi:hypothetical protein
MQARLSHVFREDSKRVDSRSSAARTKDSADESRSLARVSDPAGKPTEGLPD